MAVSVESDDGLEKGSGDLIGQCDQTDLRKGELERTLEQGIDRKDQRLDHVVQKMRKADGAEHPENCTLHVVERAAGCIDVLDAVLHGSLQENNSGECCEQYHENASRPAI